MAPNIDKDRVEARAGPNMIVLGWFLKISLLLGLSLLLCRHRRLAASVKHAACLIILLSLPILTWLSFYPPSHAAFMPPPIILDWFDGSTTSTVGALAVDQVVVTVDEYLAASIFDWKIQTVVLVFYAVVVGVLVGIWLLRIFRDLNGLPRIIGAGSGEAKREEQLAQWLTSKFPRDSQLSPTLNWLSSANTENIQLIYSAYSHSPFVRGVWRRQIVLPRHFQDWDSLTQAAVLTHEVAHIRRHDLITQYIAAFICVLFWFHPWAWRVRRLMLSAAECACDDIVLAGRIPATWYAQKLLDLTKQYGGQPLNAPAIVAGSHFSTRIYALINPDGRRSIMNWKKCALLCLSVLCLVGPLGLLRAQSEGKGVHMPSLSEPVLQALTHMRELLDAGQSQAALAEADEIVTHNANEKAQVHNMRGYAYFLDNQYAQAIREYQHVLEGQSEIPAGMYAVTLYTLAQLSYVEQAYLPALAYIEQWMALADDPGPIPLVFMAQVHAKNENLVAAKNFLEQGIGLARLRGETVNPQWLEWLALLNEEDASVLVGSAMQSNAGDTNYLPLAKVAPAYPSQAQLDGVEGWVVVEFTIEASGRTTDAVVVDAHPNDVFNESALAAVARFIYKPRVLEGAPVAATGVREKLTYQLVGER